MIGHLDNDLVEELLLNQFTGHLGCHADGITYVVPVTYAYDGQYIFGHSAKGMKIAMMQKNPEVCFQVESVINMYNWRSVIAWGTFEEIKEPPEKQKAMQTLMGHLAKAVRSPEALPAHARSGAHNQSDDAVVFKIRLHTKTGRFEKN